MRVLVLTSVVILTAPSCDMVGERPGAIASDVECPSCSVVIDNIVTLKGAYHAGPPTTLASDATGRFYLQDRATGSLEVYGPDGSLLNAIGRRGAGPGEYQVISDIFVTDDGIVHVIDGALTRHSEFLSDGSLVRDRRVNYPAPPNTPMVPMPDGHLVLGYNPGIADSAEALLSVSPDGSLHPFGERVPTDPTKPWLRERLLCARSNGELVVVHPYLFTVDVYRPNLAIRLSTARQADWIPSVLPSEMPSDGLLDRPLTPYVYAIWEGEHGLLWLHMRVPSADWRPGPSSYEELNALDRGARASMRERPRIVTIVEVVDIDRRHVVARSRFDGSVGMSFGDGLLASPVEDSAGEPGLRISQFSLKR